MLHTFIVAKHIGSTFKSSSIRNKNVRRVRFFAAYFLSVFLFFFLVSRSDQAFRASFTLETK